MGGRCHSNLGRQRIRMLGRVRFSRVPGRVSSTPPSPDRSLPCSSWLSSAPLLARFFVRPTRSVFRSPLRVCGTLRASRNPVLTTDAERPDAERLSDDISPHDASYVSRIIRPIYSYQTTNKIRFDRWLRLASSIAYVLARGRGYPAGLNDARAPGSVGSAGQPVSLPRSIRSDECTPPKYTHSQTRIRSMRRCTARYRQCTLNILPGVMSCLNECSRSMPVRVEMDRPGSEATRLFTRFRPSTPTIRIRRTVECRISRPKRPRFETGNHPTHPMYTGVCRRFRDFEDRRWDAPKRPDSHAAISAEIPRYIAAISRPLETNGGQLTSGVRPNVGIWQ